MMYVLLALVVAVLGVVPYLLVKRTKAGMIHVAVSFLILVPLFYLGMPSLVWHLGGAVGLMLLLSWFIAGWVCFYPDEEFNRAWIPCNVLLALFLVSWVTQWPMFRAAEYASLVNPETRVWTQDVQPKDPKHMVMGSAKNAIILARNALVGSIGSQFEINERAMALQRVGKHMYYIVPLDFRGFRTWTANDRVPAYVQVDAEDPKAQPELKMLPENQKLTYTPNAFFSKDLERHLRLNGYLFKGLDDYTFEVDDDGRPWWVVTVFQPTIVWSGWKVTGVAIVNPATGEITFFPLDKVPAWVDRSMPAEYVENYFDWRGAYSGGWLNSFWGKSNLTQSEKPSLVYGADGEPQWVAGITSRNQADTSLIGLVYMNARTGKCVFYKTAGGSTETAIVSAVNHNPNLQNRKLHGAEPQLYNIYGTMASVVPLFSENHLFQGVAIVDVSNIQIVAIGVDQFEALLTYQKLLSTSGKQIALDKGREMKKITGEIDRFRPEVTTTGTVYFLHLKGIPYVFTGDKLLATAKLPLTQVGDKVVIEYFASGQDVVPMRKFENLSLPLQVSADQSEVRAEGQKALSDKENRAVSRTVAEKIRQLTPEQLKELDKKLPN